MAVSLSNVVGSALAGTVVADAFHAVGGDKITKALVDQVSSTLNGLKDAISSLLTPLNDQVNALVKTVNAVVNPSSGHDELQKTIDGISDTLKTAITKVVAAVVEIFNSIPSAVVDALDTVDGLPKLLNDILDEASRDALTCFGQLVTGTVTNTRKPTQKIADASKPGLLGTIVIVNTVRTIFDTS